MSNQNSNGTPKPPCSIFEIAADLLASKNVSVEEAPELAHSLKLVQRLLLSLGSGDRQKLEDCLFEFGVKREHHLFDEVGRMTRTLHDSLSDFRSSLAPESLTMTSTNIPDATDKLETVIKLTEDAANKTMDNMEAQGRILSDARAELEAYKLRCTPALQKDSFFSKLEDRIKSLEHLTNQTMVGQSFQDLSGQSLKKVINLVTDLESNLVNIIKIFGLNSSTAPDAAESEKAKVAEGKVNQDDVDVLLSELGF